MQKTSGDIGRRARADQKRQRKESPGWYVTQPRLPRRPPYSLARSAVGREGIPCQSMRCFGQSAAGAICPKSRSPLYKQEIRFIPTLLVVSKAFFVTVFLHMEPSLVGRSLIPLEHWSHFSGIRLLGDVDQRDVRFHMDPLCRESLVAIAPGSFS